MRQKFNFLVMILCLSLAQIFLPISALAATASIQQNSATNGSPGQGLEISPPLVELKANPGQTVTTTINLRNVTTSPLVTSSQVNDFGAKDELGDPQIIFDPNETSTYSLRNWIAPLPSLTLAPQQAANNTVTINVPKNAEPGGHYGVVRFTALPPGIEQTGVALSASIGALILLDVSGNAKEGLSYVEFFTSRAGKHHGLFEYGPIAFTERIRNTGNLHEKPIGTVVVKNMFGSKVASLKVNDPARNILPASIRRFDQSWKSHLLIGRFTAQAQLKYANNRQFNSQVISFWVIPYKLILIVLFILIALILLLRWLLKRYKRRILRNAQPQAPSQQPQHHYPPQHRR